MSIDHSDPTTWPAWMRNDLRLAGPLTELDDDEEARDRLCIEVREVRQVGRSYVVVRATTRRWGDSAAHEQWIRIPYGWEAHVDEIDEAIRYMIGGES